MKHNILFILLSIFLCSVSPAVGQIAQTLRGTIVDKDDQQPLIGVSVAVFKNDVLLKGIQTDDKGTFRLEEIPVGRVTVAISYLGYKKASLPNTVVNAGKETVLNIELESSVEALKEVQINAVRKGESINEMAMISARGFSVEGRFKHLTQR